MMHQRVDVTWSCVHFGLTMCAMCGERWPCRGHVLVIESLERLAAGA